jgi:hypothetical protein
MVVFSDEHGQLPHFTLTEDGRFVSTVQHRSRFPQVLNDTLHCLGYNGDDPIYRCSLSTAHGLDVWEVSLMAPFDPMDPWIGTIIGSEIDSTVEQMTLVALTSLCESCLAATAEMPTVLFLIRNQEDPDRHQCLVAMSDSEIPHFHTNTVRTIIQQCLRLTYGQHAEGLRHENAILRSGTLPPSDWDCEL